MEKEAVENKKKETSIPKRQTTCTTTINEYKTKASKAEENRTGRQQGQYLGFMKTQWQASLTLS
jgi:hypothetical protein